MKTKDIKAQINSISVSLVCFKTFYQSHLSKYNFLAGLQIDQTSQIQDLIGCQTKSYFTKNRGVQSIIINQNHVEVVPTNYDSCWHTQNIQNFLKTHGFHLAPKTQKQQLHNFQFLKRTWQTTSIFRGNWIFSLIPNVDHPLHPFFFFFRGPKAPHWHDVSSPLPTAPRNKCRQWGQSQDSKSVEAAISLRFSTGWLANCSVCLNQIYMSV